MSLRSSWTNYVIVTVVALLIWLWAAGATRETGTVTGSLRFQIPPDQSEELVITTGELTPPVVMDLAGSKGPLNAALDRVQRGLTIVAGEDGMPLAPGTHSLDLSPIIQANLQADGVALTSVKVEPERLTVTIDRVVTETIPVQAVVVGAQIDGQAKVDPAQATLRLPETSRRGLGQLRAEATLEPSSLIGLENGRRYTLRSNLRLRSDAGPVTMPNVRLDPTTAEVTFTLAGRTTALTLAAEGTGALGIPVQIALPPSDTSAFEVTINEKDAFLRNVEVVGEEEQIALIRDGEFTVLAFVQLSSDDLDRAVLDGGEIVRPVTIWSLPEGVRVVDAGQTDAQLEQERLPEQDRRDGILLRVTKKTPEG